MTAHLSTAEARRLGLVGDGASGRSPTAKRSPRARFPYLSECHACGEHFTTETAEVRHSDATGHRRYQLILTRKGTDHEQGSSDRG